MSNTAILVFAVSGEDDARRKCVPKGDVLFNELTAKTLRFVDKTGLPYFHFSEKMQQGANFGERFSNAIETIFEKGFENIITIGNDAPQLNVSHIQEAEKQLKRNKFVLGPSMDGGFYLMGLHKSQFKKSAFQKLAWQTSSLYKQLFHQITKTGTAVFRLENLFDIDTVTDVESILAYVFKLSEKIRLVLLQFVNFSRIKSKQLLSHYLSFFNTTYHNKGSPIVLHS